MFECCFTCGYSHSLPVWQITGLRARPWAVCPVCANGESCSAGVNPAGLRSCCTVPSVPSEPSSELYGFLSFLLESVAFEDGQPVVLEDGSMAYIHSTVKGKACSSLKCSLFIPWQLEQQLLQCHGCQRL